MHVSNSVKVQEQNFKQCGKYTKSCSTLSKKNLHVSLPSTIKYSDKSISHFQTTNSCICRAMQLVRDTCVYIKCIFNHVETITRHEQAVQATSDIYMKFEVNSNIPYAKFYSLKLQAWLDFLIFRRYYVLQQWWQWHSKMDCRSEGNINQCRKWSLHR